jgi:molybdenum cofactor biosynthesis enzyme MoaA
MNDIQNTESIKSRYLRLSVTNKCNFSCYYCHNEGQEKSKDRELLTEDDIVWICRTAKAAGFQKFKLTGGEPTLRGDLGRILVRLKELQLKDLSIITNGSFLEESVASLQSAGLPRLNITLNTLNPQKFGEQVNGDVKKLSKVIAGINKAVELGYDNIKLNFIYHGSQSNQDFLDICKFSSERNLTIVLLPMLMINPQEEDSEVSLKQLHEMCEDLGINERNVIVDNEGLKKHLITLNSGARVLLRCDELGDKYPYQECIRCSDKGDCREGIFPVRISAHGSLIPCLAGGRTHVNLYQIISERNAENFFHAIRAIQN